MSNTKYLSKGNFAKDLGKRIQKARTEAGLSQKELARVLRVSDKAISSYEVGRTVPAFETVGRLSKAVHKPISYFDQDTDTEDLDLQLKIKTIEKELLEIKELLSRKG